MPLIEKYDFCDCLSFKNQYIYHICHLENKENLSFYKSKLKNKNSELHVVLKWIFESGYNYDGFCNHYDEIIDYVVSLLLIYYKDLTILKTVCALIFKRHKQDELNHDLIWAYFKANSPQCLLHIAEFLKSANTADFAYELLSPFNDEANQKKSYSYWKSWISENADYLSYQGENFNISTNPKTYKVNYDNKYLQNKKDLTEKDLIELEELHHLSKTEMHAVCHYKAIIHKLPAKTNFLNATMEEKAITAMKNLNGGNL